MSTVAVTGSFDPITIGHLEIIRRAKAIFDKVVVLILDNPQKKYILDIESRVLLCREATSDLEGVEVCYYDGYAVEYCLTHSISAIVRGIRNSQDYEYEKWLESENRKIGEIETVYLYADSEYVEVSSTKARQMLVEGDTSIIPVSRQTIEKVWGETYGKPNESNR